MQNNQELELAIEELNVLRESYNEMKRMYLSVEKECMQLQNQLDDAIRERDEYKSALLRERRERSESVSAKLLTFTAVDVKGSEMYIVSGCDKEAEEITIPLSYKDAPVIGIDSEAFRGLARLKTVDIPYGIRAVSDGAFRDCPALSCVIIPGSVIYIGNDAFDGDTALTIRTKERTAAETYAMMKSIPIEYTEE